MKAHEVKKNIISFQLFWSVDGLARLGVMLCAFLTVIYCTWTLNRGFEITDEAYYLLLAMHAGSTKFYISAQQWITAEIWRVTGSISLFRAAGMVLLLASAALLATGASSISHRLGLVTDTLELKGVVFAGATVGAMLYASTISLSPSYNLLASVGAYSAAGMVLLALNRSNIAHKYALFILAGCALGVEALCKFSAGISTLVLLAIFGAIFERSRFDKISALLLMLFGAATFAGAALVINTTIADAIQAVEQGMQLFRIVQAEPMGARLVRYVTEFWGYFLETVSAFAIPVIAMVVYAVTRRKVFAQFALSALAIILMLGSIGPESLALSTSKTNIGKYLLGGFGRYDIQIIALFAMLMMALSISIPVCFKNRYTSSLFAGLFLLPYSVAIGTGNALFTQIIDSLAPWGVLIAVLMIARRPLNYSKIPTLLISVCFIVTITVQIVTSGFRPYNLASPLTKQDQATVVGNLGEIKVDAGTYNFFSELRAAIKTCDIEPGAPYIGLYNIPGVALVLNAKPLLTPWLNSKAQADFVIGRARSAELHSLVVALQMDGNGAFPLLPQQLSTFPSGYRYCGMATYPYWQQRIQIWQSRI